MAGPSVPPGMLALVSVLQYAERLTDRQAADAVRARISWKDLAVAAPQWLINCGAVNRDWVTRFGRRADTT